MKKHLRSPKLFLMILPLFLSLQTVYSDTPLFSVREYGAKGDGLTLDTSAIQEAIDECAKQGGGSVWFMSGTYLTGTLFLKSHVTLHLDSGATLLGSTDLEDYPLTIPEYRSYTDNYTERCLIYAEGAKNISIMGRGKIDGQGESFKDKRTREQPYKLRPFLIRMIECQDITIRDITLLNSPMWVQHYLACDDVVIDSITVDSKVAGNNDGIDIDSCNRVRISNCNINSGDDAIVLKSTSDRLCENVTVTNCVLSSDCNGFKLGTESNGGFKNITFSNSTIYDTRLAAIALETVDGGQLSQININNIAIENAGTALFLRLGNRARPFLSIGPGGSAGSFQALPGAKQPGIGSFDDVMISNIQASDIGRIGCSLTGIPQQQIENITLENIRIRFKGGVKERKSFIEVPEKEEAYPEYSMFGILPSYGFYLRHARNISLQHIDLQYDEEDLRPALVFDDVQNLKIDDLDAQLSDTTDAMLVMNQVSGSFIQACRPKQIIQNFIRALDCENISVMNNDFKNIQEEIVTGDDIRDEDWFINNNRR